MSKGVGDGEDTEEDETFGNDMEDEVASTEAEFLSEFDEGFGDVTTTSSSKMSTDFNALATVIATSTS